MKFYPLTFNIDEDVKKMLSDFKKKTGATKTFIVNEAVREYVKKKLNHK